MTPPPTGTSAEAFPTYAQITESDPTPAPEWMLDHTPAHVESYVLDTARYQSPGFEAREAAVLWPTVWQMACRENEIPEIGDYIEYRILDRSVLVVRTHDGTVQAFNNACRHRGTALGTGSGSAKCFVCPFHGWTYGLDGQLNRITLEWDFDHVDKSEFGLGRVRAEVADGWVFINFDPEAPSLAEYLGETVMSHLLAGPDSRMHKAWHFERVMPCNWKVLQEAFMEAYHVAVTHPQLNAYVGDAQTQYDSYGLHARLVTPMMVPTVVGGGDFSEQEILDEALALAQEMRGTDNSGLQLPEGQTARTFLAEMTRAQWAEQGVDLSHRSDAELLDFPLYSIFPNFMPFRGPAGHTGYRFRPYGRDPEKSLFEVMQFLPVPAGQPMPKDAPCVRVPEDKRFSEDEGSAQIIGIVGGVVDQDLKNLERVQRGLHNLEKLVLGTRQEANIANFHRSLDTWLDAGPPWRRP